MIWIILTILLNVSMNQSNGQDRQYCLCSQIKNESSSRIFGEINPEYFRYAAALFTKNESHYRSFCTAVLISESFLLTAANCKSNILNNELLEHQGYFVGLGDIHEISMILRKKANFRQILSITTHPDFRFVLEYNQSVNDIAIIEVEKPFELGATTNIYPACQYLSAVQNLKDRFFMFAGWGYKPLLTLDKNPQKCENLTVFQNTKVNHLQYVINGRLDASCDRYKIENKICIISQTGAACPGDLGASVVIHIDNYAYLIGIISGIILSPNDANILARNTVSTVTLLHAYHEWIDQFLESDRYVCKINNEFFYLILLITIGFVDVCLGVYLVVIQKKHSKKMKSKKKARPSELSTPNSL